MSGRHTLALFIGALLVISSSAVGQTHHRVGIGFHYWKALEDVDVEDIDEHGLGWLLTYKLATSSIVKFQMDLELQPRGYGGSDHRVVTPLGFVLAGTGIYAALGLGIHYTDGDFADKPFFVLRTGLDLELLPSIFADVNINYRFEEWDFDKVREKISTDTLTLGVAARVQLSN